MAYATPGLCTNDTELRVEAASTGQSIGQLAGMTAVPHARAARLVPMLTVDVTGHMSVFL